MVGTVMDYARFAADVAQRRHARRQAHSRTQDGRLHDVGSARDRGVTPGPYYLPGPGYGFGLGVAVRMARGGPAAIGEPVGECNWGGAGGTYFWVDPKERHVRGLHDAVARSSACTTEPLLRDMVYAAIEK